MLKNLNIFKDMSPEEILDQRKNKFLKIGRSKGFISNLENLSSLENKRNNLDQFFYRNKKNIIIGASLMVATLLAIYFL